MSCKRIDTCVINIHSEGQLEAVTILGERLESQKRKGRGARLWLREGSDVFLSYRPPPSRVFAN